MGAGLEQLGEDSDDDISYVCSEALFSKTTAVFRSNVAPFAPLPVPGLPKRNQLMVDVIVDYLHTQPTSCHVLHSNHSGRFQIRFSRGETT